MDGIGLIKPEYVWITSGVGKWTNPKGAEILAKRAAGIARFNIVNVARLLNSYFFKVDEAEFIQKSSNRRYNYMYGTILQAEPGSDLYGNISLVCEKDFCKVSYHTNIKKSTDVPTSRRELMYLYENEKGSLCPSILTLEEQITFQDPGYHYAMVLAAMVIGEPQ